MLFLMQQSLLQQESQKTTKMVSILMYIISGLKGKTYLQKYGSFTAHYSYAEMICAVWH